MFHAKECICIHSVIRITTNAYDDDDNDDDECTRFIVCTADRQQAVVALIQVKSIIIVKTSAGT